MEIDIKDLTKDELLDKEFIPAIFESYQDRKSTRLNSSHTS